MEDNYEPKTKFNSSWAKLQRIDKIKQICHNSRLVNNYTTWFKCLSSWRSEINGKMKEGERNVADTYEYLIKNSFTPIKDESIITPFIIKHKPKIEYKIIQYLLEKYELYLCDIEEKKGIGLVDDDDDDGL